MESSSTPAVESLGYVQVYTGDGKGKTTAALGLALRAVGAGFSVFIAQFVKGMKYSELESISQFKEKISLKQYGTDCFIRNQPTETDRIQAISGLKEVREIIGSGRYELVILDEINIAVYYNLFSVEDVLDLIQTKPSHVELVITGRKAHPDILEKADLITDMREVKHYYQKGVLARIGIEK